MNDYLEETLEVNDLSKFRKKKLIFTILSLVSVVFACLGVFFAPIAIKTEGNEVSVDCQNPFFVFNIILLVLYFAVFIGLTILFTRLKRRSLVEYDFSFKTGTLVVAKVFNREFRRVYDRISLLNVVTVGKVGSKTYNLLSEKKPMVRERFVVDDVIPEDKKLFYIHTKESEGETLYDIECTEKMMVYLLRNINRNVLESDFK